MTTPAQGTALEPAHSVLRYCRPSAMSDGDPQPPAFARRPTEEYASVNCVETAPGTSEEERVIVSATWMAAQGFTFAKTGKLLVSAVSAIYAIESSPRLRLTHEPESLNNGHAALWNVPVLEDANAPPSILIALLDTVRSIYPLPAEAFQKK
jgi:hypothetical protein